MPGDCIRQENPVETSYCLNSNRISCNSSSPIRVSAAQSIPTPLQCTMNLQSNQEAEHASALKFA